MLVSELISMLEKELQALDNELMLIERHKPEMDIDVQHEHRAEVYHARSQIITALAVVCQRV